MRFFKEIIQRAEISQIVPKYFGLPASSTVHHFDLLNLQQWRFLQLPPRPSVLPAFSLLWYLQCLQTHLWMYNSDFYWPFCHFFFFQNRHVASLLPTTPITEHPPYESIFSGRKKTTVNGVGDNLEPKNIWDEHGHQSDLLLSWSAPGGKRTVFLLYNSWNLRVKQLIADCLLSKGSVIRNRTCVKNHSALPKLCFRLGVPPHL